MISCKAFSLVFVLILAMSLFIIAQSVSAQTIPKPSVPEFTLRLHDSSYDIPATTSTDPYTGQQTTTSGKRIEQRTLEIRIKNVPFTPFQIKAVNNLTYEAGFYYNIRFKPHFSPESGWENDFGYDQYLNRSSGAETVYRLNMTILYDGRIEVPSWSRLIPDNAQLDFQVQALIGGPNDAWTFTGEKSDWSSTQTMSVNQYSSPSPTPTVPELSWLVIMPLLITVLSIALILRHRKTANINK